jgi:hypothetical protein
MERVSFITTKQGDDLIVAFAIEDAEPGEVKSLILLRTPKYEFILDDDERGVTVSHDDQPEVEDDLLRRITMAASMITIETKYNRYELDVSHVDREELEKARTILRGMNFDDRFTLALDTRG